MGKWHSNLRESQGQPVLGPFALTGIGGGGTPPAQHCVLLLRNATDLTYSSPITQTATISHQTAFAVMELRMQARLKPFRYTALKLLHQVMVAKQTTADFRKAAWV